MTDKEFELQKQIWELKSNNTILQVVLTIVCILLALLILYIAYQTFSNEEK